jgi:hypothetical protein
MNEDGAKRVRVLNELERALENWVRNGNEQPFTRWLDRELDSRGVPINLPIADWRGCVNHVLNIVPDSRAWPSPWNGPITRLVQATRWFARGDGRPVIDLDTLPPARTRNVDVTGKRDAAGSNGRAVGRLIDRFLLNNGNTNGNHTRTAWGDAKRVLEVMRPGWPADDDFLAIDHRDGGSSSRFELCGGGRSWLGPTWQTESGQAATSLPRPGVWVADSSATLAEWSYRAGDAKITQSALMLGGVSLALFSTLFEYPAPRQAVAGMSVSLWPEITAAPIENNRGIALKPASGRGSAQVLPIGLPSLPYLTDRGTFLAQNDQLVVKHGSAGRRSWVPLLVSWDAKRHRKDVQWRVLSVSEKSRNVGPDRAFAARVSWGRDETYIFYRSLAKPAPRAFLGHQTTARFLVGRFNRDGAVEPILKVD